MEKKVFLCGFHQETASFNPIPTTWEKYQRRSAGRGGELIANIRVGGSAKVVKLYGEGALKRRIMDMGITKGVEIYIRKVAPLGDPLELNVRGYELSLRKADAEMVEVTQVG